MNTHNAVMAAIIAVVVLGIGYVIYDAANPVLEGTITDAGYYPPEYHTHNCGENCSTVHYHPGYHYVTIHGTRTNGREASRTVRVRQGTAESVRIGAWFAVDCKCEVSR